MREAFGISGDELLNAYARPQGFVELLARYYGTPRSMEK
jgi:hypothetical protein